MKLKIRVFIVNNLVCILLILLCAQSAESSSWQIMPGRARDIGIGANKFVWVIGSTRVGSTRDYGIYRWTRSNWNQVDGAAVAIAVDRSGRPWVVNSEGSIKRRAGDGWEILPGKARDIGIGCDGSVWVIGWTRIGGGGYGIYKWIGSDSRWQQVDGAAVAIAVDRSGRPWVVNSKGSIYRREGDGWEILPGKARDIGIGCDGSVWVIGWTRIGGGGYGIYKWIGDSRWEQVDGEAVRISVDPSGRPWVVNSAGNIYKHR